jgi:hypothetical protein
MAVDRYWMSRSFVIAMSGIVGAFVLAYLLKEGNIAIVVVPAMGLNWFGGKVLKREGN